MHTLDWNNMLSHLEQNGRGAAVRSWFSQVEVVKLSESTLHLRVPSRFHGEWIQKNYVTSLRSAVLEQLGKEFQQLQFEVQSSVPAPFERQPQLPAPALSARLSLPAPPSVPPEPSREQTSPNRHPLTYPASPHQNLSSPSHAPALPSSLPTVPRYDTLPLPQFSTDFQILGFNQLAFDCASLFSKNDPQVASQPFVVTGAVGMGKSHLLTVLANKMATRFKGARIRYTHADAFTNEMFYALKSDKMFEFKAKYRTHTDCLLFDDVQELTKRTKTQEELVYVINEITARGGKVAFSSRVSPHRLEGFVEPLRSRLASGIVAEIRPPNFKERLGLLEKVASAQGLEASGDLVYGLAQQGCQDLRSLIGALLRLHLRRKLSQHGGTEEPHALIPSAGLLMPKVTVAQIMNLVGNQYKLEPGEFLSKSRKSKTAWARHVAMYLCRKHTEASLDEIGHSFGRDHATVVFAFQKVEATMESSSDKRNEIAFLKEKLFSHPSV